MTNELLNYDRARSARLMAREAMIATRSEDALPERGPLPYTGLAIRHIVAPLDGSSLAECVLPFVVAVAKAFAARVTLLRVLEQRRAAEPAMEVDLFDWEISRAETCAYLTKIEARLKAHGLQTAVEIVQGKAPEQIVHFASTQRADLIVLSSHGEGGLSSWHLSSTAQKVIGGARTSVLIIPAREYNDRQDAEVQFRHMLLPLDCSQRAECILPAATELARKHDADLILAHVVAEPELPRRVAPSTEDLQLAERLTERNRDEAKRYLKEVARRVSVHWKRVRVRLRVSPERSQALHELAAEEAVDLVVLSAHGSTGDPGKRYGGVSERFINEAHEPVIILQDLAEAMHEPAEGVPEQGRPGH